MAAPKRGPRLGAGPAHQKLLLANLASDLFRHGRITTTETKAKTLRPYAEKLITKAKAGDLHARRQVLSRLRDRDVVAYLFEDVAPRFVDRNGGYTRVLKLGPRPGDHAPMAIIELVEQGAASGDDVIEESKQSRRGLFGRRRRSRREEPEVGAPLSRDALEDVEGIDTLGDVEDGGDVEDASPDSPAPPDAADSPDSTVAADSPGPPDAAEADELDQAAEDDER